MFCLREVTKITLIQRTSKQNSELFWTNYYNVVNVIPILYEDAHNQDPPVVPPWQGGTA
jgi:hypothetical protein